MTAPARARARSKQPGHIHLPSVHVRAEHGTGFDYEEDIYFVGRGRRQIAERVVRFAALERGVETLVRVTFDVLCPEDLRALREALPLVMDEGNPDARALME